MLEIPTTAALAVGTHMAKDVLQVLAPRKVDEVRHYDTEQVQASGPICLGDVGWCDHYGHRHHDVDVERL